MIKINRTKLVPKILVGLTVLVTILGFTTAARAGAPPFIWEYFQYNVISSLEPNVVIEAPQDEPCIWGVMTAVSEDEIGYFPSQPYKHEVWIDGEKIVLRRFTWIDTDGLFGYPGLKWRAVFQVFEAGYFEVGEHEIIHEMWVQKPYYGDEVYGWRLFVTLTYTLNIIGTT
ncbi:MAG: hypothetical protein ACFFCY_16775 [Promethearchaeota archaeon]